MNDLLQAITIKFNEATILFGYIYILVKGLLVLLEFMAVTPNRRYWIQKNISDQFL